MEEKQGPRINPIILVMIVIQLLFIVLVVISIHQILASNRPSLEVEVSGLTSEIEGLSKNGKSAIEFSVYRAISDTNPSTDVSKKGINIREGSLINKYYENANIHYVNFISDIPDIGQSYQVAYVWSDDESNKYASKDVGGVVTCLPQEQLIYGDFNCSHVQEKNKKDIATMIIRAIGGKPDVNSDITLSIDPYAGYDGFKIGISYALCDSMCICKKASEEGKQQALYTYNDFIKGLGYEPDDFTHYFYNCENESMYLTEENNLTKTP